MEGSPFGSLYESSIPSSLWFSHQLPPPSSQTPNLNSSDVKLYWKYDLLCKKIVYSTGVFHSRQIMVLA
jgi:hypothetical protein